MSLKTKIALAFAIVYVVWGSTYLAIRVGLESMPPFLMAGSRFVIAGGLLWGWCEARREPRPTFPQVRNAGLAGLLLVTLGNGLVTFGEQSVPSGIAALIVAIGPVFTVLLLWGRGTQARPGLSTIAGLALGLAGVGTLMLGARAGGSILWARGSSSRRRSPGRAGSSSAKTANCPLRISARTRCKCS